MNNLNLYTPITLVKIHKLNGEIKNIMHICSFYNILKSFLALPLYLSFYPDLFIWFRIAAITPAIVFTSFLPTGKTKGKKKKGRIGNIDLTLESHMSERRQGFYCHGKCINRYRETNCNFCHAGIFLSLTQHTKSYLVLFPYFYSFKLKYS